VELIGGEESYKPVCRNCFDPNQKATNNSKNILEEKSINLTNPENTLSAKAV
jgi:hypothetical protein